MVAITIMKWWQSQLYKMVVFSIVKGASKGFEQTGQRRSQAGITNFYSHLYSSFNNHQENGFKLPANCGYSGFDSEGDFQY